MKRLRDWRLALTTVVLPALFAGSAEFVRHDLLQRTGLSGPLGNLVTAATALLGGLVYFHTVSTLTARLAEAAERERAERVALSERQAIAEELHDNLAQVLFFLRVGLGRVQERVRGSGDAELAAQVSDLSEATAEAYLALRDTIRRLQAGTGQPLPAPAGEALARLVAEVMAGSEVEVVVEAEVERPQLLPAAAWAAAQSILREALRNVRKHAGASRVRVWLREDARGGSAGVEDDGCGFAPEAATGFGLQVARRRAAAAGLDLAVDSQPGHGTRVAVSWPAAGGVREATA
jgi:signal transduction histidine kinase